MKALKTSLLLFFLISILGIVEVQAIDEPGEPINIKEVEETFNKETAPLIIKIRNALSFKKHIAQPTSSLSFTNNETNPHTTKKHKSIFGNTLGKISLIIGAILLISYLRALNEA